MIEAAPAKVNLALHLRRRRDDGYHDLETVFVFTDFGDTLRVEAHAGLALAVTGPLAAAVGEGDNLVLRAARALAAAAGLPANAALTLDKHIPVAAGLGGGSADAAAALRLLNRFWHLDWPIARLLPIAASLGADVPACLIGRTITGTGRGEVLAPVDLDVAGTPILLVNPRVAVPTGPVFAGWDGIDRGPLDPVAWRSARNDLAEPAIGLAPVIAEVLSALANTGASLIRMSGSGATCFALYADAARRDLAAGGLGIAQPGWWVCPTTIM
ncbi:MAG: 4-(cytidine 5'-diphospho)-2-C-methyl-D-erythritol kinase [Janthinobacterium lividum]